MKNFKSSLALILLGALTFSTDAVALVFNTPHFTPPGRYAVGIEPELNFGDDTSGALNLRMSHGLNELNNVNAFIGTGGHARAFRAGGNYTFDFFPDVGAQPGIGLALQGMYLNRAQVGTVELQAIPYIHKAFVSHTQLFEPFVALPIGLSLASGRYRYISTVVLGSMFAHNENVSSIIEVGIKLNNVDTYVSGGVIYYL